MKALEFSEIKSGMTLWDNKEKRWQKVLRVYLWKEILDEHPNRYYAKKPKGIDSTAQPNEVEAEQ